MIYNYLFEPLSLERPLNIHDENSDNMKDNLIDETYMIEDEYINSETNERLLKVINNLPEKYQLFIKIRFGLYDGNEHTLEETARILYSLNITDSVLTRERIRQIQDYVINVLKDKKILKYIDNERYNEKIESHKENKTTKSLKKSLNL